MSLLDSRSLLHWFRSDSHGLVAMGVLSILRGISYFPFSLNTPMLPPHWLENFLTFDTYGTLWIILGAGCLLAALIPRLSPLAVGCALGLHVAAGMSIILGWIYSPSGYGGWSPALAHLTVIWLILWAWGRGSSSEIRIK